jgi:hypothetical protein
MRFRVWCEGLRCGQSERPQQPRKVLLLVLAEKTVVSTGDRNVWVLSQVARPLRDQESGQGCGLFTSLLALFVLRIRIMNKDTNNSPLFSC